MSGNFHVLQRTAVIVTSTAVGFTALTVAHGQVTRMIPGDPVSVDAGQVTGTLATNGVRTYFGIPFAAPPLRDSRWRAPQPVTPWQGILTANRLPPECVQGLRSSTMNHYFGDELSGEDCLYLNVWAPPASKTSGRLPVLVWIYGGGFNIGSASSPIYAGSELAKRGVIYVAPNYRVGIMGFLAHPEMTKESGRNASGNWGFLDQVAALKWVQKNIAAFDGDPTNVTLIGQSAGSMSINNLQASPLARGLFRRAIGMSGSTLRGGVTPDGALAQAEEQGVALQGALKAKSLAEMRGISADKIVSAAQTGGVRATQIVDGYFLPDSVENIFTTGKQNDAAILTGSTAKDIGTTVPIRSAKTLTEYKALATQMYGDKVTELLALYPATTDAEAVRQAEEIGRNSGFTLGARAWARAQTRTGKEAAYLFILSRVQPFTPDVTFSDFNPSTAGAYHMGDVPYWLGTYEAFNLFRRTRDWTAWDRELSDDMQDVVVAFANNGNPSTRAVQFTRYAPGHETRVDFGDTIKVETLNTRGMDFLENTPAATTGRGRGGRGGRGTTITSSSGAALASRR
jgi:para-nitrobenzyl esterase